LKAIAKMNWSQERVAKVADVMRMEYMSSEESEIDEESQKVRHYNYGNFPGRAESCDGQKGSSTCVTANRCLVYPKELLFQDRKEMRQQDQNRQPVLTGHVLLKIMKAIL
jgi:hypothetical protein